MGGIDETIHKNPSLVKYARLLKPQGWYTVQLLDILLRSPNTVSATSIGLASSAYNGGKGAIVDSGTTDTYLPRGVKKKFEELFRKLSGGLAYSNNNIRLTKQQYAMLPTIVYRYDGFANSCSRWC